MAMAQEEYQQQLDDDDDDVVVVQDHAIAFCDKLFDDAAPLLPATSADLQEALAKLQGCAQGRPFCWDVHCRIAMVLVVLDRCSDAIAEFELLEQKRRDICDSSGEAMCCIERGLLLEEIDEEDSRRALLRGVALAHQSSDEICDRSRVSWARYVLGKLLCRIKDYESAIQYLQDLDDVPDPSSVHYLLGVAHKSVAKNLLSNREQALETALYHCRTCVELGNDLEETFASYKIMLNIYLEIENYEKARQVLAEAASLARQEGRIQFESDFWWRAGLVETNHLGRHRQALVSFTFSLEAALKIVDATDQVHHLLNASTWLKYTLLLTEGIVHKRTIISNDTMSSQTSIELLRAEALVNLGVARLRNYLYKEARQCFQDAGRLISDERNSFSEQSFELNLLLDLQWGFAELARLSGEWEEALKLYRKCKGMAQSERIKLQCDKNVGFCLQFGGRYLDAFEAFTKAMEEHYTVLDTEWDIKAELLKGLGQALFGLGNLVEAISRLEAARQILEEKNAFNWRILGKLYLVLFYAYIENQQIWNGFQLAKSFQAILNKYPEESYHQQIWQLMSGVASSKVVNHEEAVERFTKILETESCSDWVLQYGTLANLANAYRNLGDLDNALIKYEEARQLLPEDKGLFLAQSHIDRAGVYMLMVERATIQMVKGTKKKAAKEENNGKAFDEYERAITILESLAHPNANCLAVAYAGQALILVRLKNPETALHKLEKARAYAGSDRLLIVKLKDIQARLYHLEGAHAQAEAESREAAILFATLQIELKDLESAWVSLLGGHMKHVFIFMQRLLVGHTDYKAPNQLKALLWAERGRMRLYCHIMGRRDNLQTKQIGKEDPLWFDKDDELAKECIHRAIRSCGSETAIVEYTCAEPEGYLYVYVLLEQASELSVHCQPVRLRDFFANHKVPNMGKTLNALIKRTRSEIVRRADVKAKLGLSILYTLLVEPIWQYIESCKTVIFAPHESLSLVPFAALYDKGRKEFLIEQKAVGIIPSIRALTQCFLQQSAFEERMQAGTLATPFVAGDPQPMGLGLPQLEGAAMEADIVAKKLHVEPFSGLRMTKQAVIDGLCNASVVVLVTHGIMDTSYPYGALVMQGQWLSKDLNAVSDIFLRSFAVRGVLDTKEAMPRTSEVLTADEIGKLEGGICAGLVVLSACQTGEGKVSSEGLLGLGRAVLQSGASSVVLTLWKVDDDSTKDLVTGLFQHLVDSGQNVVVSLQLAMLLLLKSGLHIYNWAPLMAFGSPTFRLEKEVLKVSSKRV
ncbi:hypothetical protein O6H91_03G014100 [Diphasiastrum complanatum]|uniref:Uncharacterized protein n=5 Tax=Diphasiastrum complanatum TaxID=34168 RepID=A0ACC2E4A0_DIPCM|nr:hypothetical protein O6H91_03G014100 [Diphasiastrum complanatum]KAJ7561104.1 hypothetical protein O6H91_03G014100 [Diphasiastrum complanatum]KAJ7561105.1 hypothetical protein O6H91_03G014100 [Diphasiastrum complanatum]KAJ7561106.1 hypothetical protein O6H91_03G014100 [Diphasiastrum complanatum]KAJ7561107.1 hypothetical protein O6H91_03G014100 [Diphasiastrum complanatum]